MSLSKISTSTLFWQPGIGSYRKGTYTAEFGRHGAEAESGKLLQIEGEEISDAALADYIVRDMRLLMVGKCPVGNPDPECHRHW